ncbi:MAG: DUF3310 domain-containing protein [Pseudomonadota bacterium]|nr:DUF3310 domain-containing protein [Pseudomonadota bacterium]
MAWWLVDSILKGTMETDYPVRKDISMSVEGDGYDHSPYYYDYDRNGLDENPFEQNFLADNDDQAAHHFQTPEQYHYPPINNEVQKENEMIREDSERKQDNRYKYHEAEIIKDIEEYVSGTYNGHYTGDTHEYRNVQTIDLMAARSLASSFCQSNILKYGSRYGSKDGRNKKDLMKVIHYAMLLLHFDEHYGKPSITSGNIDHNMP